MSTTVTVGIEQGRSSRAPDITSENILVSRKPAMRVRWSGQCPVCPVTSRNPRRPGEFAARRAKSVATSSERASKTARPPWGRIDGGLSSSGGHLCARDPVVLGDQLVEIDRDRAAPTATNACDPEHRYSTTRALSTCPS